MFGWNKKRQERLKANKLDQNKEAFALLALYGHLDPDDPDTLDLAYDGALALADYHAHMRTLAEAILNMGKKN